MNLAQKEDRLEETRTVFAVVLIGSNTYPYSDHSSFLNSLLVFLLWSLPL
jgi:hypothetical protein